MSSPSPFNPDKSYRSLRCGEIIKVGDIFCYESPGEQGRQNIVTLDDTSVGQRFDKTFVPCFREAVPKGTKPLEAIIHKMVAENNEMKRKLAAAHGELELNRLALNAYNELEICIIKDIGVERFRKIRGKFYQAYKEDKTKT